MSKIRYRDSYDLRNMLINQGHDLDLFTIEHKMQRIDELIVELERNRRIWLECKISYNCNGKYLSVRQFIPNYESINKIFANFLWEKIHIALQCKKNGLPIPKDAMITESPPSEDDTLKIIWKVISLIEKLTYEECNLPGIIAFTYTGKWKSM